MNIIYTSAYSKDWKEKTVKEQSAKLCDQPEKKRNKAIQTTTSLTLLKWPLMNKCASNNKNRTNEKNNRKDL